MRLRTVSLIIIWYEPSWNSSLSGNAAYITRHVINVKIKVSNMPNSAEYLNAGL